MTLPYQLRALTYKLLVIDNHEATVRRATSTAYYAVFRLIIDDGLALLFSDDRNFDGVKRIFHRQFTHTNLRDLFQKLQGDIYGENRLRNYPEILQPTNRTVGKNKEPIYEAIPQLKDLGRWFNDLQKAREIADYNTDINYLATTNPYMIVDTMEYFFDEWQLLKDPQKGHKLALVTLLGLLLAEDLKVRF